MVWIVIMIIGEIYRVSYSDILAKTT